MLFLWGCCSKPTWLDMLWFVFSVQGIYLQTVRSAYALLGILFLRVKVNHTNTAENLTCCDTLTNSKYYCLQWIYTTAVCIFALSPSGSLSTITWRGWLWMKIDYYGRHLLCSTSDGGRHQHVAETNKPGANTSLYLLLRPLVWSARCQITQIQAWMAGWLGE